MLKVPENQVAGHQAIDGRLGPLIDDSGFFYKPLQSDSRGTNEVAFYESFSSDTRIPDHIRRFFPVSHGTKLIEASDGSGLQPHLVMEDINFGRIKPSVLDVKIGSRTWYPQASEDYIAKCVKKDRETSTLGLGFRLSGLQIYKDKELGFWKPGKKAVQHLSAKEVKSVLKKFVSSNASEELDSIPDCAFASIVYGGSKGILSQLLELKAWFEDQTIFHFYSCSILVMFEKERAIKDMDPVAQIKLVDFAHVLEGEGVIDHNFLGGLCSLIKFVSEILTSPDECTSEACSEEEEEAQNSSLHLSNGKV